MNVVVYTKENCSYCMNAKLLLTNKGVLFREQKLGQDFTRETILEMFPSAKTFPVVVIDGFNIGGYLQLKEKLEESNNDTKKLLIEG